VNSSLVPEVLRVLPTVLRFERRTSSATEVFEIFKADECTSELFTFENIHLVGIIRDCVLKPSYKTRPRSLVPHHLQCIVQQDGASTSKSSYTGVQRPER